ncbi:hypothetical protein DRI50_08255 [candidate division KSB1 bacterium]|nr:MAG: hypothetical protein DRI50_08255 [candidate division KSB1 bacterium]
MKTQFECIPCILKQTIETARLATDDIRLQKEAINRILIYLTQIDYNTPPPALGRDVYGIIHEITGNYDPYKELKQKYNALGLAHYDEFLRIVFKSPDPVMMAAKLAVVGNIIDFGPQTQDQVNIKDSIQNIAKLDFEINDFDRFINDLKRARSILYIADNAGEIVFDRLFIEILQRYYPEIGLEFKVAVRGAPIINDATKEDALMVGLDKIATIIENGDNAPATLLDRVSPEMKRAFEKADIIIAKGMGNYETLDERTELIYYLLKVKCALVSQTIGAKVGSLVFKRNERVKG